MGRALGNNFRFYRLYYSLFAFAGFAALLFFQVTLFSPYFFSPTAASEAAGIVIGLAGLLIMVISIKKYFGRLSGLKTLFLDEVNTGNKLLITGIHRYVRHPLYSGTFLFIWGLFLFVPHASLLISNCIITIYTLIGVRFEENKLVKEFGQSYDEYKKRVPAIIPSLKPFIGK